jgi:hypothetical protein
MRNTNYIIRNKAFEKETKNPNIFLAIIVGIIG